MIYKSSIFQLRYTNDSGSDIPANPEDSNLDKPPDEAPFRIGTGTGPPQRRPGGIQVATRGTTEANTNDEVARLLAALIRLQTSSQAEAITELHRSGIGPKRIAELLGTSAGTVNVAIQRTKKPAKKKGAQKS